MGSPLTVGGLFSGIGGWELGLERAGMDIAWHCESDPFCRKVLAKHWPDVPCYKDVCGLTGADVSPVDVLCGGFPCQDISLAGKGAGIDGARSGLWSEFARLIGELRPRYVCVENVPVLLGRGLDRVLGDLSALGFDAEWDCISASAFGAPHERDRVWIVAYPSPCRSGVAQYRSGRQKRESADALESTVVRQGDGSRRAKGIGADCAARSTQDPNGRAILASWERRGTTQATSGNYWRSWTRESPLSGVGDGIPNRLDRLGSLGNALVPQIAQWIGERIVSYEASLDGETVALDV